MEIKVPRLWSLLLVFAVAAPPLPAAPERWKTEIDQLTANDASQPPPAHAVVFVGSSSIRFWTSLATDFPGIATINRGFGGSELTDSVYYADRLVLAYQPRTVVLYAGDNDIAAGKSAESVAADFTAFRTKIHGALPQARILYLAIKPSPSRKSVWPQAQEANRLIAADCTKDPRCTFIDVATPMLDANGEPRAELYRADRLHLLPEGYALWTKILAPYLQP
jgi:lysophospholipase L1-like esterase